MDTKELKITIGGFEITIRQLANISPTDTDMLRQALGLETTGEGLHGGDLSREGMD